MKRVIPNWIGKSSVSGAQRETIQLLESWASLLDTEVDDMGGLDDNDFLVRACEVANGLQDRLYKCHPEYKSRKESIWVGFPNSPIGRLNAQLVPIVWGLHRWIEEAPLTRT